MIHSATGNIHKSHNYFTHFNKLNVNIYCKYLTLLCAYVCILFISVLKLFIIYPLYIPKKYSCKFLFYIDYF